ncbi:hypothetical protein AB6A40_004925 [Gnathostoma spinigerum]|uniref:Uncharacterized protein n=1 Tax=Gnathostoma spinigerum TaxID=75299 RepID=A0ABD6EEY3_9BILA
MGQIRRNFNSTYDPVEKLRKAVGAVSHVSRGYVHGDTTRRRTVVIIARRLCTYRFPRRSAPPNTDGRDIFLPVPVHCNRVPTRDDISSDGGAGLLVPGARFLQGSILCDIGIGVN